MHGNSKRGPALKTGRWLLSLKCASIQTGKQSLATATVIRVSVIVAALSPSQNCNELLGGQIPILVCVKESVHHLHLHPWPNL